MAHGCSVLEKDDGGIISGSIKFCFLHGAPQISTISESDFSPSLNAAWLLIIGERGWAQ
jgi:hypothetical protein